MKIDLHCHTRKAKKGDAQTREVTSDKFISELENAQVSIVAITNHNLFDYAQYCEFKEKGIDKKIQVWPGIELDVVGEKSKGHCIVICNPAYEKEFDDCCKKVLKDISPDKFSISIYDMVEKFREFDILVIAHYGWKKPSLIQSDLEILKVALQDIKPLFLEVPQLRSAGILYAHNLNSFIGSDVHDWNNYSKCELPELKMPIDNYDQFNLLIKKDAQVLKTFVNQKFNEEITIAPFEDCKVTLPIYNDINIFFGGKGTGKSSFLNKLKFYFDSLGNSDVAYYDGQTKETEYKKMIKVDNETSDFDILNIKDCEESFNKIKEWKDVSITPITSYVDWAKTKDSNKLSEKFGFKDSIFSENINEMKYTELNDDYLSFVNLKDNLNEINHIDEYLENDEHLEFIRLLNKMITNSKKCALNEWISIQSLNLEKFTIDKMKTICKAKSGVNQFPSSTGLLSTFINCLDLHHNSSVILTELDKPHKSIKTKLGTLQNKGNIYLEKKIFINPYEETKLVYRKGVAYTVNDLKSIKTSLQEIKKLSFTLNKGSSISNMNTLMLSKNITSLKDFIGVKGTVVNSNGDEYKPSNGEQSMLLLTNAIIDDSKNIYILDEPELSVGHKYINDVIVPRLIELSKLNKTVIISTHDANIAVRTLPLLSVYREYKGNNLYYTYIGSPFTNMLVNPLDECESCDWTEKSLSTLEGGEFAFIERGEIYGK